MTERKSFDPFHERAFAGWLRVVLVAALLLTVLSAPSRKHEFVRGLSGDSYPVYEQEEIWRSVGPVLSVRFTTSRGTPAAVAAEVADLLPYFASRADSSDLRYLLIRATRPVIRIGPRLGVYRSWSFRYSRNEGGWVSDEYW